MLRIIFYITNLIQIEEKVHVPVTIHFLDYAIICIVFMNGMFPWYTFFMADTQIKEHVSFESWEKKELLLVQFLVKFVMLHVRSITLANWFACLPACMSMIAWVSLTTAVQIIWIWKWKQNVWRKPCHTWI